MKRTVMGLLFGAGATLGSVVLGVGWMFLLAFLAMLTAGGLADATNYAPLAFGFWWALAGVVGIRFLKSAFAK